ncbi:hypothetical protein ACPPVU_12560 [Mucilaginibacter sp. McL0603]|uniref:hypothetical protein n=1 Tax=Mucilaginibacter sp. McL0603 TaxID=3415670 RepID=UPI003CE85056
MKIPADISYTQEMLREAMELLEDTYPNPGMFERQRHSTLRKRFEQHELIKKELRTALNGIDTQ